MYHVCSSLVYEGHRLDRSCTLTLAAFLKYFTSVLLFSANEKVLTRNLPVMCDEISVSEESEWVLSKNTVDFGVPGLFLTHLLFVKK